MVPLAKAGMGWAILIQQGEISAHESRQKPNRSCRVVCLLEVLLHPLPARCFCNEAVPFASSLSTGAYGRDYAQCCSNHCAQTEGDMIGSQQFLDCASMKTIGNEREEKIPSARTVRRFTKSGGPRRHTKWMSGLFVIAGVTTAEKINYDACSGWSPRLCCCIISTKSRSRSRRTCSRARKPKCESEGVGDSPNRPSGCASGY